MRTFCVDIHMALINLIQQIIFEIYSVTLFINANCDTFAFVLIREYEDEMHAFESTRHYSYFLQLLINSEFCPMFHICHMSWLQMSVLQTFIIKDYMALN